MCTARCRRPRRWTSLRDSTSITRSCSSTTSNNSSAADNLLASGQLLSRYEARVTDAMVSDGTVGHYVILRTRTCHCHIVLLPANHGNRPLRRDGRGGASHRWRGHAAPSLLLSPALFVVLQIGLQAGKRLGERKQFQILESPCRGRRGNVMPVGFPFNTLQSSNAPWATGLVTVWFHFIRKTVRLPLLPLFSNVPPDFPRRERQ
jgi:hypothetical protein